MYYIIRKSDRIIEFRAEGSFEIPAHVWVNYDSDIHYAVICEYVHETGQEFKYPITIGENGFYVIAPFTRQTVYNIISGIPRIIASYLDDPIQTEETYQSPMAGVPLDDQKYNGASWVYDNDKLREKLKIQILEFLQEILSFGTEINGHVYQCREEDLFRMSLAVNNVAIGGTWGGAWRDYGNQWNPMSFEEFKTLAIQAGNFYQTSFMKSRQLIDELQLLSDSDLIEYNISYRWGL